MKYSRKQDIDCIIKSIKIWLPKKKKLIKRIYNKYGTEGIFVVLDAFSKIK